MDVSSSSLFWSAFVGAFAVMVTGCGGGGNGSGGGGQGGGSGAPCTPDLPSIEKTIFQPSCALSSCHVGVDAQGSLDLSGDTASLLIDVPSATCQNVSRVVSGDPEASLLYQKLAGTQKCGAIMPTSGALPAAEIACVRDWIASLTPGTGGAGGGGGTGGAGGATGCEMCGGAACVDLLTDPMNCGACGEACDAGVSCSGGGCACAGGGVSCNGVCVDTGADTKNCGACGKACAAGQTCTNSECVCPDGGTLCGGACIDTQSDPKNCGACGNQCSLGQTCAGGMCTCGSASVSFSAAVQPIFTSSCTGGPGAGCHKGAMPSEGLSLAAGQAYANLVNVAANQCADGRKRVLPGQPSESYLIDKMMGIDLCFGTKMPKMGMLPQAQIQTVSDWICAGAPNN